MDMQCKLASGELNIESYLNLGEVEPQNSDFFLLKEDPLSEKADGEKEEK